MNNHIIIILPKKYKLDASNNFYYIIDIYIQFKILLICLYRTKMSNLLFALSHSELGVSHFTTDLILVLSFAIVTALPMSLLRPQIQEKNVKSNIFNNAN